MTAPAVEQITECEFAKPCETPKGCDREATIAVWCDHHLQGCDYAGFRCDVHYNELMLETQRLIGGIEAGFQVFCGECDARIEGATVSAHLRGIRL